MTEGVLLPEVTCPLERPLRRFAPPPPEGGGGSSLNHPVDPAAVQHLALATGDIFATAAALAERGFRALRIGENYYGDLEARFGLDPGFTARLRAANILYDCDTGGGEFFQLFTRTFDDRFFFEIVERRGYTGFGAPNAAIRLAVQNRLSRHPAVPRG